MVHTYCWLHVRLYLCSKRGVWVVEMPLHCVHMAHVYVMRITTKTISNDQRPGTEHFKRSNANCWTFNLIELFGCKCLGGVHHNLSEESQLYLRRCHRRRWRLRRTSIYERCSTNGVVGCVTGYCSLASGLVARQGCVAVVLRVSAIQLCLCHRYFVELSVVTCSQFCRFSFIFVFCCPVANEPNFVIAICMFLRTLCVANGPAICFWYGFNCKLRKNKKSTTQHKMEGAQSTWCNLPASRSS